MILLDCKNLHIDLVIEIGVLLTKQSWISSMQSNIINPLLPEGGRSITHGSIAQTKKNILYSFFTIDTPCHNLYFYEVSFVQHKNFVR